MKGPLSVSNYRGLPGDYMRKVMVYSSMGVAAKTPAIRPAGVSSTYILL